MKKSNKFVVMKIFFLCSFFLYLNLIQAEERAHLLLQKYCFDCHDEDVQKGNFQMDVLETDVSKGLDADQWHLVLDQINLNEMPPKKKKQPNSEEQRVIIQYLTQSLRQAAENKRKDAQVVMRRLTNQQYSNTLRDLLHLDIDFGKSLPEERFSEDGYRNYGEEQVISLLQTEYYQKIADEALSKVFTDKPPTSYKYEFRFGHNINRSKSEKGYRKISGNEKRIEEEHYITKTFENR